VAVKPLTREQEIVRKLRTAAYTSQEKRIQAVKDGEQPYSILSPDELLEILPGRRINWLTNVADRTPQPDIPLWAECEDVIDKSPKGLKIDEARGTLTFQSRECQTRTIRLDRIFEITIRVIPERTTRPTPIKRRPQMTKRTAVA